LPEPLAPARRAPSAAPDRREPTGPEWDELLRAALAGHGVTCAYQPIIDLRHGVVAGYEALARFTARPGLTPDRWFHAAAARDLATALEARTLAVAPSRRPDLPPDTFLAVNVEPESLLRPLVTDVLGRAGRLDGVVVEITEHRPLPDGHRLEPALEQLRGAGALIAVDDAGAGYAGLQQVLTLRPAILKLDRALVEGLDHDEAKAALVEMLGLFAGRIDAWLLAEGVETVGEARRLSTIAAGAPAADR
jgi:EAL domain-containing protein (putative c-di-GMP-specific phosphodiesterase class I)